MSRGLPPAPKPTAEQSEQSALDAAWRQAGRKRPIYVALSADAETLEAEWRKVGHGPMPKTKDTAPELTAEQRAQKELEERKRDAQLDAWFAGWKGGRV